MLPTVNQTLVQQAYRMATGANYHRVASAIGTYHNFAFLTEARQEDAEKVKFFTQKFEKWEGMIERFVMSGNSDFLTETE